MALLSAGPPPLDAAMLSPENKAHLRKLLANTPRTAKGDVENDAGRFNKRLAMQESILHVTITGFAENDAGGFTEYLLETHYKDAHHKAAQRYSAFLALHEKVLSKHEAFAFPFPVGKSFNVFYHNKSERLQGLQAYMHRILDALNGSTPPPEELLQFLGVPAKSVGLYAQM